MFNYEQHPDPNGTVPTRIVISNEIPTLLAVPIQSIVDIGGTLSFELSLDPALVSFTCRVLIV